MARRLTDEEVDQWAARIVANAPEPTPAQLELVRRLFTKTSDSAPVSEAA